MSTAHGTNCKTMVGKTEVPPSNVVHGAGYSGASVPGAPMCLNGGDEAADRGSTNRENEEEEVEPLFQQVYELCEIIGKGPFSLVRYV